MNSVKRSVAASMVITAAFAVGPVRADDMTASVNTGSQLRHDTAGTGQTRVAARTTQSFADFAGSTANASSLVTGLRQGTPITLNTSSGTGQPVSSLTFAPPTGPMGNGNVFISLALARQELANAGIVQPTPDQIRTALVGGTIATGSGPTARTVTLPGVLTQRSQGMGWGNIARSQGMNLGRVISAARHGTPVVTPTATARSRGIVTAANGPVRERHFGDDHRGAGQERETEDRDAARSGHHEQISKRGGDIEAEGMAGRPIDTRPATTGNPARSGIVTAAGTPATTSGLQFERGHGNAQTTTMAATGSRVATSGIVTGSGAAVTSQVSGWGGDRGHSHVQAR